MIYLDYAKSTPNGYILNFFADKEADIADISNGKRFVTKNGTDYGVPLPSSTVVITMPDKTKKTYVLNGDGEWQEGGVDMDYSKLTNAPITLANLAEEGFVPEANTYYEHLGETTEDFIKGIIYLYDGKEYKAIDGSGSGAGVQADYNQNDSTAADYIKNRPFYEGLSPVEVDNFKVVSGNLEEEGSEVTVEHNGKRYTGTVSLTSDGYSFDTGVLGKDDFVFSVTIMDKITNCIYYHKKTYEIKANDEVIFNGVKYLAKVAPSGGLAGKVYISDGEINFESGDTISASFIYIFNIDEGTLILDNYIIYKPTTNIDFNLKISQQTIKTIDPKFIKDMYYSTEAFVPFIDFKVISGDINTIGSTMVVSYGGKEYTETVKDAAEQGSSDHKPYIGANLVGGQNLTEENPFCYGFNILSANDTKQLFCAPKHVSENETVIYNGENKTVKKTTIEGISFLYVGNLHLLDAEFEDTGEQYLTLFDYLSVASQGQTDLTISIVTQDSISCEVKGENISYINPKYIKDMYYTKPESDIQKTLVFKGEINLSTQEISSSFEAGDIVYLKEEAVGLDVTDEAKIVELDDGSGSVFYIGNLSIIGPVFGISDAVDTKEDYIAAYVRSKDGTTGLIYINQNKEAPNNIEIYKGADPIVRIPEKYLPLDIAKKSYVDTAISDAITKTLNTEV